MARVNKDDPAIQAVVQKMVAEALKAEQRDRKQTLKDLRTWIKYRLKRLTEDLRETNGGRTAGAISVGAARDVDDMFKDAA